MADREKVIKGLETCIKYIDRECPIGCPYYEICTKQEGRVVFQPVLRDAFELLKEQETESTGRCRVFQCKKCGYGIDDIFVNDEEKYQIAPRYCPNCGKAVKQNDSD